MNSDALTQDRKSWQSIDQHLRNGAEKLSPLTEEQSNGATAAHRTAWRQWIDQTLMAWARDRSQLEDDRLDPPSAELIQQAFDFAQSLRQGGYPPPTSIVPDPNGGIVIDRTSADCSEEIHFWDDGTVDYCRFKGIGLVERRAV